MEHWESKKLKVEVEPLVFCDISARDTFSVSITSRSKESRTDFKILTRKKTHAPRIDYEHFPTGRG